MRAIKPSQLGRASLSSKLSKLEYAKASQGCVLALLGVVMWSISNSQPAWYGNEVGPGLMAQLLAKAIIGLGAIWAVWCVIAEPNSEITSQKEPSCSTQPDANRFSASALLGSVLLFALTLPVFGLAAAAGIAAGLAAFGAGERRTISILMTVVGLMTMAALIGILLLPPSILLWPIFLGE